MRYHNLLAAGIAFASAAAAQFIFPESSSNLQVNQAVQIRWNKANLQEPLSINLVPAGQVIRQDIVLQQVAVNIGNVGLFQWSADQTISAFPKFAMVIVDARSQVVVSQTFAISGLTKQPNQQIDLGKNGGNAGGKKNNNNNNNNNGSNNKNEKQKDKAKNNDNNKNGNSRDGGNQNDDKKQQQQNGQKEKATDKQQQNNSNNNNNNKGSSTLLPLPGLPPNDAPPVSLKPLPNAAESVPASKPAAAAPTPTAAESSASPASPAAGNEASSTSKPAPAVAEPAPAAAPEQPEPEPAAAEPVPTTAAASETVKEQPEPAQPAANGFTTLQPSAEPASAPAKQVKAVVAAAAAAPVPESTLKADALAAGKHFREKTTTTSDVVVLTALGAQAGQDKTISTAITPVAPARFAASNAGGRGAEETQGSLAPDDAKPTVLSGDKSGAEKKVPGLALGLLGIVVAGVALL
ncbi:hypothetical protein ARSEF4850_000914 [Beauveria asiatica]